MSLFDTEEESDEPLASRQQVTMLVQYGHRADIVRGWTRERAELVIRKRKAGDKADARRAMSQAGLLDDAPMPGASIPERLSAAVAVEQAVNGASDELLAVLMASLYVMTDAELREAAVRLAGVYRTNKGGAASAA